MKSRTYVGVLILLLILTLSGCSKKTAQYVPYDPLSIVIYHSGQVTTLEKDDQLYKKIVELNKDRFTTPIYMHSPVAGKTFATELRKNELTIEYIYTKYHQITYQMPTAEVETTYSRALFTLTGLHANQVFLGYAKGYCKNPFGPLKSPEELIKLLEKSHFQ